MSQKNVTTFHFRNGITVIVPTEAEGPVTPATAADLIHQAADDLGWALTPNWTWDYWADVAEDEIEILVSTTTSKGTQT